MEITPEQQSEIDNIVSRYETDLYDYIQTLQEWQPPVQKIKPSKTDIAMITIAPPVGTPLQKLKKLTERFVKWKGIQKWMYSYELQKNGNPHSHIVIRSDNLKALNSELKRQNKSLGFNIDFQYRTKEPLDWAKAETYITKDGPATYSQ